MLNTPSELSNNLDEAISDDLEETTEEIEESTAVEDDEESEEDQDEEVSISASELEKLKKGQMLQSDYTRKRQAEAAELKARMAEIDGLLQEAETLEAFLEEDENSVDWDDILSTSEVKKLEAKFRDRRKKIAELKDKAGKQKAAIDSKVLEQTNQVVFNHFKNWQGNEKEAKADQERAYKYAISIGHTNETISKITDPQTFIALIEAAKYHEIKSAKPEEKLKRKAPKTVTGKKKPVATQKSWADVFYGKNQEYRLWLLQALVF